MQPSSRDGAGPRFGGPGLRRVSSTQSPTPGSRWTGSPSHSPQLRHCDCSHTISARSSAALPLLPDREDQYGRARGGGQAGLCGQPGGSPLWGQPGGSLLWGQVSESGPHDGSMTSQPKLPPKSANSSVSRLLGLVGLARRDERLAALRTARRDRVRHTALRAAPRRALRAAAARVGRRLQRIVILLARLWRFPRSIVGTQTAPGRRLRHPYGLVDRPPHVRERCAACVPVRRTASRVTAAATMPGGKAQTMASCLTMTTGMARKPTLHMRLLRN